MCKKYYVNLKIGYINVNGIVGFKFFEIKGWLLLGRLDVFIILEIKLDVIFLNS